MENVFIATVVPVSQSSVYRDTAVLARLGYCDMDLALASRQSQSDGDVTSGGLDVASLAAALAGANGTTAPGAGSLNTTAASGAGAGSAGVGAVLYLLELYQHPEVVDQKCRGYYWDALGWLVLWGLIWRLLAYVAMQCRVSFNVR